MQAVILAAGRGTRMSELTTAVPKPMLDVDGKALLEYKLEAMPDEIDEIIVVVGYLGRTIRERFAGGYSGKKLTYIEQTDLNGTAGALWQARERLKDRFLILNGDDIFAKEDLRRCAEATGTWKLLVQELPELHRAGAVRLDDNADVADIVEGDLGTTPGLASTNMFSVDTRLFDQPLVPKQPGSLEFGLPQTIVAAAHALGIRLEPIYTTEWIQINYPSDLVRAARIVKERGK